MITVSGLTKQYRTRTAVDDLTFGGGKLLAAESVAVITNRNDVTVIVQTPEPAELVKLLAAHHLAAEATGDRVLVLGTTKSTVSQIAFDNRIRVVELTESSRSLEDSLLDMTKASAELLPPDIPHPIRLCEGPLHDHRNPHDEHVSGVHGADPPSSGTSIPAG